MNALPQAVEPLDALVEAIPKLHARGMAPATSGNFSIRDGDTMWITASGQAKDRVTRGGFCHLSISDGLAEADDTGLKPSAETALHLAVYRRVPSAGCVLHVHADRAVLASMLACTSDAVELKGWELLKALAGVTDPSASVLVPVFGNDQDIAALASRVGASLEALDRSYAFLIRAHGMTVWGADLDAALRHLEALDAMFGYALALRGWRT